MTLKKSVWIPTVLCAAVAGTSSYIAFGEDSPVERSYFINEYAVATADAHEEILEKDQSVKLYLRRTNKRSSIFGWSFLFM